MYSGIGVVRDINRAGFVCEVYPDLTPPPEYTIAGENSKLVVQSPPPQLTATFTIANVRMRGGGDLEERDIQKISRECTTLCLDDCLHPVRHRLPQSLELLGRNPLPTERKNSARGHQGSRQSRVIDMHLSPKKNPGVLNWVEFRGVRRMGLEKDVILLEGEHELSSMYASIVSMK